MFSNVVVCREYITAFISLLNTSKIETVNNRKIKQYNKPLHNIQFTQKHGFKGRKIFTKKLIT